MDPAAVLAGILMITGLILAVAIQSALVTLVDHTARCLRPAVQRLAGGDVRVEQRLLCRAIARVCGLQITAAPLLTLGGLCLLIGSDWGWDNRWVTLPLLPVWAGYALYYIWAIALGAGLASHRASSQP